MRRLTDFEKEVVNIIYEARIDGTDFSKIFKTFNYPFLDKRLLFEISKGDSLYSIDFFATDSITEGYLIRSPMYLKQLSFAKKRLFDYLELIHLLEENGLIYLQDDFSMKEKTYFPPFFPELVDFDTYSQRSVLTKNERIYYYLQNSKRITEKDFNTLSNSSIQTSEALQIYISNGFRTEEQRSNDRNYRIGLFGLILALGLAIFTPVITDYFKDENAGIRKVESYQSNMVGQMKQLNRIIKGIERDLVLISKDSIK